jgi:hypothetical protein
MTPEGAVSPVRWTGRHPRLPWEKMGAFPHVNDGARTDA